jgi:hypothetical protein
MYFNKYKVNGLCLFFFAKNSVLNAIEIEETKKNYSKQKAAFLNKQKKIRNFLNKILNYYKHRFLVFVYFIAYWSVVMCFIAIFQIIIIVSMFRIINEIEKS